jgi:hypothetical protein
VSLLSPGWARAFELVPLSPIVVNNYIIVHKLCVVGLLVIGYYAHSLQVKKDDYKGHPVAVKIISKAEVRATLEVMVLMSNLTFGLKIRMNRRIRNHYLLTTYVVACRPYI